MRVKCKDKINLSKTISVDCGKADDKEKTNERIQIVEDLLYQYNYNVVRNKPKIDINSQDEYFVPKSTSYEKEAEQKNAPEDEFTLETYYVLNFSIDQIKDVGIDLYLMKVTVYDKATKKIIAYGEVENFRGRLYKKFEKLITDFLDSVEFVTGK